MIAAVRRGQSLHAVARQFGVGVATVSSWVERAKSQRLDRVDWSDRSHAPHKTRRTDTSLEDLVLKVQAELAHSDLGAIGADAIRQVLLERNRARVPAVRTIHRIRARRGALAGGGGAARADHRPAGDARPRPAGWGGLTCHETEQCECLRGPGQNPPPPTRGIRAGLRCRRALARPDATRVRREVARRCVSSTPREVAIRAHPLLTARKKSRKKLNPGLTGCGPSALYNCLFVSGQPGLEGYGSPAERRRPQRGFFVPW
jgi:transposase-like protein